MNNRYQALITEDRRRAILAFLAEVREPINEYILKRQLEDMGMLTSQLHADLRWLHTEGLVVVEDMAGVLMTNLTSVGADVVAGRLVVKGVARKTWD